MERLDAKMRNGENFSPSEVTYYAMAMQTRAGGFTESVSAVDESLIYVDTQLPSLHPSGPTWHVHDT